VYILSNTQDTIVPPELHKAQKMFYEGFEANVEWVEKPWDHNFATDVPAEWGEEYGVTKKENCLDTSGRRLYNCGFDTAGEILKHMLPNLDGSSLQAKDNEWINKG